MLGHVHPDGDVLGTLLGLGLAMEAAGWSVTYAGPDPVPDVLDFIPGATAGRSGGPRRGGSTPSCSPTARTTGAPRGCWPRCAGPESRVLNIDHHPDNRRYGTSTGSTPPRPPPAR